jgi:hypothetical protein
MSRIIIKLTDKGIEFYSDDPAQWIDVIDRDGTIITWIGASSDVPASQTTMPLNMLPSANWQAIAEYNEALHREYILKNADWYVNEDHTALYICPDDDEENIGPDDATMDALIDFYRTYDSNPREQWELDDLGLRYVDVPLRRWSLEDGYYTA